MFKKLLVANRGEIACRILATAHRLGISTVAIYSDVDRAARHVSMAEEAVRVGAAHSADSYLNIPVVLKAALMTGSDAVHPGYGFLSENPEFAQAALDAGLVFVGPSVDAIRAMGLKDSAKALMEKQGVPVVPGYHGSEQNPDFLMQQASHIGYPILIKARAGGGGKGMRLVHQAEDFLDALASAQRESQASFGDAHCLIEKYIEKPRHIEFQIFGDASGQIIHCFERDCSIQRRHQKIIEEAPAPGMTDAVRQAMGEAAIQAARAIDYVGAGTVEFIVDGATNLRTDGFWFMEMNTRLQVEHPVSEAVTGLDFVELQLQIAAGNNLPVTQSSLSIDGVAIEARVYAEHADNEFLPATGTVDYLSWPEHAEFAPAAVRIDSGLQCGDEISPWYDPLIAKIIVHGSTRQQSLAKLEQSLRSTCLSGTKTNLAFLSSVVSHNAFQRAEFDTGFLSSYIDELIKPVDAPGYVTAMASMALMNLLRDSKSSDPWLRLIGWQHWSVGTSTIELQHADGSTVCSLTTISEGKYRIHSDTFELDIRPVRTNENRWLVDTGDSTHQLQLLKENDRVTLFAEGQVFNFNHSNSQASDSDDADGGNILRAPMPGLVKAISVTAGSHVIAGQAILVLEAMKMEHTLSAPQDCVVKSINIETGSQVTAGEILVELLFNEPDMLIR